ncbi:MAG: hypothetical protein JSS20_12270 [Proteobacteria bacterium]|nr:hypothetical protein [Pseudomonadota bacterium]
MSFLLVHATVVVPVIVAIALVVSSAARRGLLSLLRLVARPLLIAAVVAIAYDGTRTLAGGSGLVITSLGEHWKHLSPNTLEALHNLLTTRLPASTWNLGLAPVLRLPAWLALGTLGLALAWIGRRRKEVGIFIN